MTQLFQNQVGASGTLDQAIKDLSGSYADLAARTQNELKDLGLQLFQDIEPVLVAVLKGVRGLIGAFKDLPQPARQAALGLLLW